MSCVFDIMTVRKRSTGVKIRRIGRIIATATVVIVVATAVLSGVVGGHPTGGIQTVIQALQLASVIGAGLSVVAAVATAVTEGNWQWTALPIVAAIAGIVLVALNVQIGPALLAVAFIAALAVFVGERTDPYWQKRIITLFAGLGVGAIIVGDNGGTAVTSSAAVTGIALTAIAFVLALIGPAQRRQWPWIALIVMTGATGFVLPAFVQRSDASLLLLPLALITFVYSLTSSDDPTDRPIFGLMGLFSVLLIVIGGTLIGGVLGTQAFAEETAAFRVGMDLYLVAGALAVIAWVLAVTRSARHRMWGWFLVSLFLVNIGALMYGLFGPSLQDFEQTKEARRLRKAAGY
jgi:hypothetical protein